MKTAIVIPARYASSRLPGKPLLRQTGKYLVQHVYERACLSGRADRVIVATDDPRIAAAVRSFGGEVAMTSARHRSGSDRVAEVASNLTEDVIVNLQGDEPLVDPAALDALPALLDDPAASMATLAVPLRNRQQWQDPNCVKVVCDRNGHALYFSRSPIPFVRDGEPSFGSDAGTFLQHLGLYAYRREFLLRMTMLPPHPLEELEKLEQLRVLAAGYPIRVGLAQRPAIGVDTYEDYLHFVEVHRRSTLRPAA